MRERERERERESHIEQRRARELRRTTRGGSSPPRAGPAMGTDVAALDRDELLLGAQPVLGGVSALVEMDVVRTRRDVLPCEHDRLRRLHLLRAARGGSLGCRLGRRGGLGGLTWHC